MDNDREAKPDRAKRKGAIKEIYTTDPKVRWIKISGIRIGCIREWQPIFGQTSYEHEEARQENSFDTAHASES